MFKEVADIQTADMLNLPVPKANYENIIVEPSDQFCGEHKKSTQPINQNTNSKIIPKTRKNEKNTTPLIRINNDRHI